MVKLTDFNFRLLICTMGGTISTGVWPWTNFTIISLMQLLYLHCMHDTSRSFKDRTQDDIIHPKWQFLLIILSIKTVTSGEKCHPVCLSLAVKKRAKFWQYATIFH